MIKLVCSHCGHLVDAVEVDGYSFGDTLLEGVKFSVSLSKGKLEASFAEQNKESAEEYFKSQHLDKQGWMEEAIEYAMNSDYLSECLHCDIGLIAVREE